jgi:hypothetical protein
MEVMFGGTVAGKLCKQDFCHVKAALKNQTFSSLERGFFGLARLSRGRAEA